jgi:hypothetical protein
VVLFQKRVDHFFFDQKGKNVMLLFYFFSFRSSLKNSSYRLQLSSYNEAQNLVIFDKLMLTSNILEGSDVKAFFSATDSRRVCNCVLKDLLHLVCM